MRFCYPFFSVGCRGDCEEGGINTEPVVLFQSSVSFPNDQEFRWRCMDFCGVLTGPSPTIKLHKLRTIYERSYLSWTT